MNPARLHQLIMIKEKYLKLYYLAIIFVLLVLCINKGLCEENVDTKKEESMVSEEKLLKNLPSIDELPAEVREAIRTQKNELEGVDYSNFRSNKG